MVRGQELPTAYVRAKFEDRSFTWGLDGLLPSFELSRVKIHPVRRLENIKGINKNNFCYISPICPEALSGWICTKFGIEGPLVDVINCADFFYIDRFRDIDFVGGWNLPIPIGIEGRR